MSISLSLWVHAQCEYVMRLDPLGLTDLEYWLQTDYTAFIGIIDFSGKFGSFVDLGVNYEVYIYICISIKGLLHAHRFLKTVDRS